MSKAENLSQQAPALDCHRKNRVAYHVFALGMQPEDEVEAKQWLVGLFNALLIFPFAMGHVHILSSLPTAH